MPASPRVAPHQEDILAFEVLLALAHPEASPEQVERARAKVEAGASVEEALEMALVHYVPLLFAHNVMRHFPETLSAERRNWLAQEMETAVYRDKVIAQELVRIMKVLDAAGVPSLAFKGAALGLLSYDRFGLRPYSDLDLWIAPDTVPQAMRALAQGGYHPVETRLGRISEALKHRLGQQQTLKRGGIFQMDLHTNLMPPLFPQPEPFAAWLDRAIVVPLPGTDKAVRTLSRPDALLAVCYQGAKDRWEYLKHVADVAGLARHLDETMWTEVLARARALRCERMLALGLRLAIEVLDVEVSPSVQRWLHAFTVLDPLVAGLAAAFPQRQSLGHFSYWRRSRYFLSVLDMPYDRLRYVLFSLLRRTADRLVPHHV